MNYFLNKYSRLICLHALMVCGMACPAWSQQSWGYSQYLFNLYDINSAYAGNHGAGSFGLRYRAQWIRMAGAPETQVVSFHTPLFRQHMGVGLKVLNENIGARNQFIAKGSVAYKLYFDRGSIALGIAGGAIRQIVNRDDLNIYHPADVQLLSLGSPVVVPIVDASIFVSTNRFYFGVESGRINRSRFYKQSGSLSRLYLESSMVCGYIQPLSNGNQLQWSVLGKYTESGLWQAEVNMLFLLRHRVWLGGGYRWKSSAQFMGCFHVSEQLRIGISYDISTATTKQFNDGSAEVFVGFNLRNKTNKSIRYF